jgi:hypothetical protein
MAPPTGFCYSLSTELTKYEMKKVVQGSLDRFPVVVVVFLGRRFFFFSILPTTLFLRWRSALFLPSSFAQEKTFGLALFLGTSNIRESRSQNGRALVAAAVGDLL